MGYKPQIPPKIEIIPDPNKSPKSFWGFSGFYPQKTPILYLTPSPKNPRNFSNAHPRPRPVPEISGRGRGKPGIGAPFYHTTVGPNARDGKVTKI